jgi:hypothetical protein
MRLPFVLISLMTCAMIRPPPASAADEVIPAAAIAAIDLTDAMADDGWVAPVSPSLALIQADAIRWEEFSLFRKKLEAWAPNAGDTRTVYRRLNAAALVDLGRLPFEGEINYVVFAEFLALPDREQVRQSAARIALGRASMTAEATVAGLQLACGGDPAEIDERIHLLARKLLVRMGISTNP